MAKNHRLHSRPKQQTQTTGTSPPHAKSLGGGPGTNTLLVTPAEDQDEDDICPVCESECTCDNRPRHVNVSSSFSHLSPSNGSARPANPELGTGMITSGTSLKIKLTLPPSLQKKAQLPTHGNKASSSRHPSAKKLKHPVETTSASGNVVGTASRPAIGSPFSAPGQPLIPSGHAIQLNADGTVPKKRGRPSKAAIAAREAVKAAAHSMEVETPAAVIDQTNVVASRQYTQARKPATPKKAAPKAPTDKKGKVPEAPMARAQRSRPASVLEVSSISEMSDYQYALDDDDTHSIQFPTFMSAISMSSNCSSASSSDSDSEMGSEDTHHLGDDAHTRMRRELMGDVEQNPHRKWTHRDNWEIRPRKKSVGADGSSDAGVDADSDEDTEEEEEEEGDGDDEDEADPGVGSTLSYVGVATGWSDDDEESSFDADLFFSNLSDSTDDHMDEDEEGIEKDARYESDFDALTLSEVAAAGFLSSFEDLRRSGLDNLPFEVTEGWDGEFMFTNGLKEGQGILDLDFEASAAQLIIEASNAAQYLDDADIMMATSEEEEAMEVLDCEDDDIDLVYDSDDESTSDELVDLDGILAPRTKGQLRFPALTAINPLSTLSPVVSPRSRSHKLAASCQSPKPADILAGKVFMERSMTSGPDATFSGSDAGTSSIGSSRMNTKLAMTGDFKPERGVAHTHLIISGSQRCIPAPYPTVRRLRRGSHSSRRSGSCSDIAAPGSGRSRPSSLLARNHSPYQSFSADDFMTPSSPGHPPTELIELDEVLDASFLESEPCESHSPEANSQPASDSEPAFCRHLDSLSRWDFIPLDTFRRTRAYGGVGSLEDNHPATSWPGAAARTVQPADGFSYGSSAGGMMRGSPLGATLWEAKPLARQEQSNRRRRSTANMTVIISPVLLPVLDGDRTPTNDHLHHTHYQHHPFSHAQNAKSRKELRKEKKRTRKATSSAANHHHRHHYPNAKSRSSSSMQRPNFSSSASVPHLSI